MKAVVVFSLFMAIGFALQAIKLRNKAKMWLIISNVVFSTLYFLSAFISQLRVPTGILTVIAFIKPSVDRSKSLNFRLAHLFVLILAVIYCLVAKNVL